MTRLMAGKGKYAKATIVNMFSGAADKTFQQLPLGRC